MAESSAKKLAAQREELESKGSKAVEALFEANESVVDLDAAERIGLISAETRAKIEANFGLGEAREIFGRILNKEKERGKTDPEAFKRAFEAMYGKFVLEERDVADVESPDGSLITVLRKVLKFPVEEKDGQLTIAGRPELQAAAKRLRMLQAESGAELEIGDLMIANRQEQGDANNAVERLKKELDALEYAAEKGKEIKPAGLKDLRIDLELKYGKTQKTREALDSLNGPKNKQLREEVDRLALIEAFFSDAANKLADQLDGLATELEAKGAKDEAKGIRDVAEKIKNLMRTRPLDVETWKNFLKNDLSVQVSFLTSRKCRKILGASDKQDELKKSFGFVKENLDGVGKFNTAKGQLNAAGKKISDLEAEQIRSENDEFEVKMEVLYTLGEFDRDVQEYLLDKVPNEINERIKAYLENFSKNIVYDSANVSAENVLGFLKNDYQVFVAYLDEALTTAVREKNHERNDAEDKLSKLAEKGKRIGGFKAGSATVENILKDAFAGVDPLKILELEREHTEVQAKEEALTEHYKYFSGKESAGIHGKFLAIEDSVVTSGEVRKKEADFKKAEADKTRLDQLKDTFSEAKVSSLLDLFREFDALKDSYLPMEDRKNLDATITAKSSSISIMEKELEAEFTAKKKQKSGEEIGQDSSNYQQRIEQLRKNLEKDIEALEKLKKQKADWDKFKELAKKLRTELQRYCREYLASFELIPDDQHKKIIEQKKRTLDAMNVESGFNPEELKNAYQLLEPGFSKSFGAVKAKLEDTEITLKEKQNFEDAKSKLEKAKVLYADLKPIMDRIKAVKSLGVDIEHVDTMVEDFKKIKIDDINFSAKDLTEFYSKYFSLLLGDTNGKKHLLEMFEKRIAELKSEVKNKLEALNHGKATAKANENLTDAQAAKKIIGAILAHHDPSITPSDKGKLSSLILAGDVMKLQTTESYRSLAERGGAELLETAQHAGFADKLLRFQYKVGETVHKPLEGMKPADFENEAAIENLFKMKRLDHKNGFIVLAAFERMNPKAAQISVLEKKLKELIAHELGADTRMHEAGVVSIVNEAYEKQLEAVRPLVQNFFETVDKKHRHWDERRVQSLDMEYQALRDLLRTDKIDAEVFEERLIKLREKAKEYGVIDEVKFRESSLIKGFTDSGAGGWLKENDINLDQKLRNFWNHSWTQGVRDFGWGTLGFVAGGLKKTAERTAVGTVKTGGSLAWQAALTPFRAMKYTSMLAATPLIAGINLFRKNKWTPFSIKTTVQKDVNRALKYTGNVIGDAAKGVVASGKDFADVSKFKMKKYSERIHTDHEATLAKELWEAGQASPLKLTGEPWIDMAKYKEEVKKLDEILAGGVSGVGGHDKKAA